MIRRSMPAVFRPEGVVCKNASCGEVREIAAQHLVDIREKISDLRTLERLLAKNGCPMRGHHGARVLILDILDIQRSTWPGQWEGGCRGEGGLSGHFDVS